MVVQVNKVQLTVVGSLPVSIVVPAQLETNIPPLYRANWRDGVQVTTSWTTDVVRSGTGAESRVRLRRRPVRTQVATLTALRHPSTGALLQSTAGLVSVNNTVPLYADRTRTTEALLSGASVVPCDARFRRFFPGARVAIVTPTAKLGAFGPTELAYGRVLEAGDDYLLLYGAVGTPFPERSFVYPMLDVWAVAATELAVNARNIVESRVTVAERSGTSTLPGLSRVVPTHSDGLPILDVAEQRGSSMASREAEVAQSGRDAYVFVPTDVPADSYELDFAFVDRASAFELLSFFDVVRGSADPFWILDPANVFRLVSATSTSVDVVASGHPSIVTTLVPTIGFRARNGSRYVRDIASVDDNGATWTLNFATPLPTTDLLRVTAAHLVRSATDYVTEEWVTDEAVRMALSLEALGSEADVAIE